MGWKKFVIISLILILLQSCHLLYGYKTNKYGSKRPVHNRFEIGQQPYNLMVEDPIKTDVVYTKIDSVYLKSAITKENKLFVYNTFLRFFPNGRYFQSSTKNVYNEALEDYNNLEDGIIGYL